MVQSLYFEHNKRYVNKQTKPCTAIGMPKYKCKPKISSSNLMHSADVIKEIKVFRGRAIFNTMNKRRLSPPRL